MLKINKQHVELDLPAHELGKLEDYGYFSNFGIEIIKGKTVMTLEGEVPLKHDIRIFNENILLAIEGFEECGIKIPVDILRIMKSCSSS